MVSHPPSSRAAQWLSSGWLDVEFYAALRGRDFADPVEAAEDFVDHGMQERLSPHPFLHFVDLPAPTRRAWRNGRVARVLADLASGAVQVGTPSAARDPAGRAHLVALARRLGVEADGAQDGSPPVDWAAVAGRIRRSDRTSVVVVAAEPRPTIRTVQSLLDTATGGDVQVLVIDCGSPPHVALGLHGALVDRPEVEVVRLPVRVAAPRAADIGMSRCAGENVLLLLPQVVLRRGALASLMAVLDDPAVAGVQPLLLGPDDTVVSAGLVVAAEGEAPARLLAGHPADDARRLEGQPLAAISAEAMALRVEDVAAVGGLESDRPRSEAALDLCARLLSIRPGGFRVVPPARATVVRSGSPDAPIADTLPAHPLLPPDPELYQRIGFVTGTGDRPAGGPEESVVVAGRRRTHPGQRRWSIKLPSTPGRVGDLWGDTHFAEALSRALRDRGEDVVTYRRGAHADGPTHLDDVSLALRGLHPVPPTPGQVNVLWVISHPDDVDPSEFQGYDHVFAASRPWSVAMSARAGRQVLPLLQASEFEPSALDPIEEERPADPRVVFVGNAGDRERLLIRTAVEAEVPLAVYGRGWDHLPVGVWRGEYVENQRLPELYRRHGIVLADHWPDMARHGFIANRVFDAVASTARVICDDVTGVHDVFDPRDVVVVHDAEELRRAVAHLRRTARGDDVPRPPLSFHDRARTLVEEVLRG